MLTDGLAQLKKPRLPFIPKQKNKQLQHKILWADVTENTLACVFASFSVIPTRFTKLEIYTPLALLFLCCWPFGFGRLF